MRASLRPRGGTTPWQETAGWTRRNSDHCRTVAAQWLSARGTNLRGVCWEPERDTLIAEYLPVTVAQLFATIAGGLGISVVVVGVQLAATTGIVGATGVAMGLIPLPVMVRNGYANPLSPGIVAASGTLGPIPESWAETQAAYGAITADDRRLRTIYRSEIDSRSADPERAFLLVSGAQELLASETAWRERAGRELLPELRACDLAIQGTNGLRQQPHLPRRQALFVASCSAGRRDISLNF
ncbi:TRAP transporter large permease subunit [Puniceibacterium confluentis]|uniref:TRAP transporter large permease subunit n=2 Tax=Puniceibacterium confluentis TaxID=1958944 RepID=UPI00319E83B1